MKFDLLKLLTREEPIAGVEIGDFYIRLALLSLKKSKKEKDLPVEIKILKEIPLKEGVIVNGEIKDKEGFKKILEDFFKNIRPRIRYVVISISSNDIYSHLYSFPQTVVGEKLEETMKLTVGFQLPVKTEECYLDWEKISAVGKNEIFLAAIPRMIVDAYTEVFVSVGVRPVAVEFYPLSASRVIDFPSDACHLLLIADKESMSISVIENKIVKFSRFLPAGFSDDEIRKTIDFYESGNKIAVSSILLVGDKKKLQEAASKLSISQAKIIKIFDGNSEIEKNGAQWSVSLGAALRGIMPRLEDTLISLMPVGTEEAYENQKAVVFSEFLANLSIGLSLFFSVIFVAGWFFMVYLQQNFNDRLNTLSNFPVSSDAIELETRAMNFNELVERVDGLLSDVPQWSVVIEEIKTRVGPGIIINNFSAPSVQGIMSISGLAQSRLQLNMFKKMISESSMFTEATMPLTNLELKENIPFSISFKLKNVQ